MEVLQLQPETKTLVRTQLPIPTIESNDVLVKVAYAGVCGTDLHIIKGDFPASDQPVILGHEICGTVCQLGSNVKHVKCGENVGVDPNSSCGLCKYCRTAAYHMCPDGALNSTLGIFRNGGWAQYCKAPAVQVYKLPESISLEQGVMLEPLSCVTHGMSRIYPLAIGSVILILGAGIAGNLMASVLNHLGHRNVIISEPHDGRSSFPKKLFSGTTYKIIKPDQLKEYVKDTGIDLLIDCSGNGEAIETSLEFMNPGGKVCIYGVASPQTTIKISPFLVFLKELSIFGTLINRFSFNNAINLMEAMGSSFMDFEKLGVKVFSLDQYQEALDTLDKGLISKAVFKFN